MSLYLKYRPQSFSSLVGQDHIATIIKNAISKNMVAHAYLFCGPRGTGKTSTARLVAKAINCTNLINGLEPCNECEICVGINNGSLTDVVEIDAASNRGIDEMRELRSTVKFAPSRARNKVYIIDEVHMLTAEAFNALLKTLEEPPEKVFFILATTEVHKIPQTIMSRCQRFDFKRIEELDMFDRLVHIANTEQIEFEEEALKLIAEHTDGGLRDAISLLDQLSVSGKITVQKTGELVGSVGNNLVQEFLDNLLINNEQSCFKIVNDVYEQGYDLKQFQTDLLKLARKSLSNAVIKNESASKPALIELLDILSSHQEIYRNALIPQLSLEVLIVKFCNKELLALPKPEIKPQIAQKIEPKVVIAEPVKPTPVVAPAIAIEPAPKVETPKAEPKIINASSVEEYKKYWKEFLGKINKPFLHRSMEQGKIINVDNGVIEIEFHTDFHFNAVNKPDNIKLIEDIFAELTNAKAVVRLNKNLEAAPVIEKEQPPAAAAPAVLTQKLDEADLAGFFDGEYI